MMLAGPFSSGVAVGSAGSATNNADTPHRLTGRVAGIYVKYGGTAPPATTDVVIATKGTHPSPPATTLLTLTNKNTDGWFYPRVAPHSALGVALATLTIYESVPIDDIINISIAQADSTNYAEVWFILE